ncbi:MULTISPECIES: C40 family peptidase [unclassified Flavobacterium]|uniref:C40 family peptidase n=1 Tax=unclassified Flavobacterium TaxID=196869 RepID=UPI0025B870DC|nr:MULTISPECIES: C40 family peptidase [unclassified Flavobacterium]
MSVTKNTVFLLTLLLCFSFGHAQIITSKKEAIKKGVYEKPADKKNSSTTTANTDKPKLIAYTDTKPKETVKEVKATNKPKKTTAVINETNDDDLFFEPLDNYLGMQMVNNALAFVGVRYHGGGTTTAGMDCSGMVTAVFNIFDIKLPRSSNDMAKVGEKLDRKDVRTGDLIFFRTNGKSVINHVGMVVEVKDDEIKFVHSSTQSGVIVSSTKEPYYQRTFAQVNRVVGTL